MRRKKVLWVVLAGGIIGFAAMAATQFLPQEIAEDAKWEDFLATANIAKSEQMSGPEAVTNPYKLWLEKDGVERNALWKNIDVRTGKYTDSWKWEIAAYRVDRLLGIHMVPVTIERRFKEDRGSLQLWEESMMSLKKKVEDNVKTPPIKVFYWNRATYLQRLFDNFIANDDRHMNNILITKDWRMLLIDHSRSFRTSKTFTDKLIYRKGGKEGDKFMSELPRPLVEKLKELTVESLKNAVGEYLTDEEINACLKRRDLIIAEVNRLIKEKGEENVLYDLGKTPD
jgi:hypothetical protein